MPAADGKFHVYALPVGQGSGQIIQCPNGDVAIIDLGSRDTISSGFWSTNDIKAFLLGHYNRIKNIVITHNHDDHYRCSTIMYIQMNSEYTLEINLVFTIMIDSNTGPTVINTQRMFAYMNTYMYIHSLIQLCIRSFIYQYIHRPILGVHIHKHAYMHAQLHNTHTYMHIYTYL